MFYYKFKSTVLMIKDTLLLREQVLLPPKVRGYWTKKKSGSPERWSGNRATGGGRQRGEKSGGKKKKHGLGVFIPGDPRSTTAVNSLGHMLSI